MPSNISILVTGREELFMELLGHFSAQRYSLVYAKNAAEAWSHCEANNPRLILALLDQAQGDLSSMLRAARSRGARILGLSSGISSSPIPDFVDRVVPEEDLKQVLVAANALLKERRRSPRVMVELPIKLEGRGETGATMISGRSLFVPTEASPEKGEEVELTLQSGEKDLTCAATVVRVGPGESGEPGMVLEVPDSATEVRTYLEGLVRWLLVLQHYQDNAEDDALLPEPITQLLVRRALQELLQSRETSFKDGAASSADLDHKLAQQDEQIRVLKKQLDELIDTVAWSPEDKPERDPELLQQRLKEQESLVASLRQQVEQLQKSLASHATYLKQTAHQLQQMEVKATDEFQVRRDLEVKLAQGEIIRKQMAYALENQEEKLAAVTLELKRLRNQQGAPGDDVPTAVDAEDGPTRDTSLDWALSKVPNIEEIEKVGSIRIIDKTPNAGDMDEVSLEELEEDAEQEDLQVRSHAITKDVPPPVLQSEGDGSGELEFMATGGTATPGGELDESQLHSQGILAPRSRNLTWLYLSAGGIGAFALGAVLFLLIRSPDTTEQPEPPPTPVAVAVTIADSAVPRPDAEAASTAEVIASDAEPQADAALAQADTAVPDQGQANSGSDAMSPGERRRLRLQQWRERRNSFIQQARNLMKQEKHKEAREFLTKALKMMDNHRVRMMMAQCHEASGEMWPAAYHLEKGAGKAPRRTKARLYVKAGQIYAKLKKRSRACKAFKAALAAVPDDAMAKKQSATYCK